MGAHAFHPKPPRNRRLNEAWAGNILPFPRKSPDFFWSPYPSHPSSLSVRPLTVSFRSFLSFYSIHRPTLSSSLLPSSSFVLCLLRVSLSFFIPRSFLAFVPLFESGFVSFIYISLSLFFRRREISTITDNSIMSLHFTPSRILILFYAVR